MLKFKNNMHLFRGTDRITTMINTVAEQISVQAKANFLGAYYGQKVYFNDAYSSHPNPVDERIQQDDLQNGYLELDLIDNLTDQEYTEICMISGYPGGHTKDPIKVKLGKAVIKIFKEKGLDYLAIPIYQYLRSQGYVMPVYIPELNRVVYVPELLERGWVKLKSKSVFEDLSDNKVIYA